MAQSKANPPGEAAYERLPDGLQAGPRHSAPHLQFSVLICSCDEKPPEGNPAGTIQLSSLKEDLVLAAGYLTEICLQAAHRWLCPTGKLPENLFLIYLGNQYSSCSSRAVYL